MDALVSHLRSATIAHVGTQYLERATHRDGWHVKDMEVIGRFIGHEDQHHGDPYWVVVDGRTLTWDELGQAFESFEGWELRIQIDDHLDDLRSDAEVYALPLREAQAEDADVSSSIGATQPDVVVAAAVGSDDATAASTSESSGRPGVRGGRDEAAASEKRWSADDLRTALVAHDLDLRAAGTSTSATRTHLDRSAAFVDWLTGASPPTKKADKSVPAEDLAVAQQWVTDRNDALPERAVGQIRYELDVDGASLTLYECRPPWRPEFGPDWTRFPIVRFRYTKTRKTWATYWRDQNLKFHRFDPIPPSRHLGDLIDEVEDDRTGIFWG